MITNRELDLISKTLDGVFTGLEFKIQVENDYHRMMYTLCLYCRPEYTTSVTCGYSTLEDISEPIKNTKWVELNRVPVFPDRYSPPDEDKLPITIAQLANRLIDDSVRAQIALMMP